MMTTHLFYTNGFNLELQIPKYSVFRSSVPNLPNYAPAMNSGFHITQSINLNCVWQNGPQQRFLITHTHY